MFTLKFIMYLISSTVLHILYKYGFLDTDDGEDDVKKEIERKQIEISKHYDEIVQLEKQIEELQMKSTKR